MKNKNGFVLLETLVVTIFTLIIFTLLYTSVVPLLGKYKDLSYYNDIDVTYDLYYLKKLLTDDDNYESIANNSYKSIKCTDLTESNKCNSYFDALNIDKNDELIYLDLKTYDTYKTNLSSDIQDYINRIDENYYDDSILLLKNNNYISFLECPKPNEPIVTFTETGSSNSCGYENSVTVKITCDSSNGIKSFLINDEEMIDSGYQKSYSVSKTLDSSSTINVSCISRFNKVNTSNTSKDYTVCVEKDTNNCLKHNTYNCCTNYYTSTGSDCKKCSNWEYAWKGSYTGSSYPSAYCKNGYKTTYSGVEPTDGGYSASSITYKCESYACKTYGTCEGTCKTYVKAWFKK